ncbi:sortilin-related receptor-like [Mya arenaria]|uniref:sortilin-related receptor-like n=1 Tax=Mya arenaria TaxID=6604 RepID=UPI0022DF0913|nr:sortilin-related receptor-like [Mya arenaria]
MQGVLAVGILMALVYSIEGKPKRQPFSTQHGPFIVQHFAPVCDGKLQCGCNDFMGHPECVSAMAVCDGVTDCSNGADEQGCPNPNCKSQGLMTCSDRKTCGKPCDGFPQCSGLEDERMCPTICPKGNLQCRDGKTCISAERLCDGHDDCMDGQDEERCNLFKCASGQILCSDGKCGNVCDGEMQCSDKADEQNCKDLQCPNRVFIDCDSFGFAFKRCQVPNASMVLSVVVTARRSISDCTLNNSFGRDVMSIWVDNGCRATFEVCYK